MKDVLFKVQMSCGGCSGAVTRILKKIEGMFSSFCLVYIYCLEPWARIEWRKIKNFNRRSSFLTEVSSQIVASCLFSYQESMGNPLRQISRRKRWKYLAETKLIHRRYWPLWRSGLQPATKLSSCCNKKWITTCHCIVCWDGLALMIWS